MQRGRQLRAGRASLSGAPRRPGHASVARQSATEERLRQGISSRFCPRSGWAAKPSSSERRPASPPSAAP
eukprot:9831114-Lingulodinium_polyedra.AAC.1